MITNKLMTSEKAIDLIKSNYTVAINGFIGFGHSEELSMKLEEKFLNKGNRKI